MAPASSSSGFPLSTRNILIVVIAILFLISVLIIAGKRPGKGGLVRSFVLGSLLFSGTLLVSEQVSAASVTWHQNVGINRYATYRVSADDSIEPGDPLELRLSIRYVGRNSSVPSTWSFPMFIQLASPSDMSYPYLLSGSPDGHSNSGNTGSTRISGSYSMSAQELSRALRSGGYLHFQGCIPQHGNIGACSRASLRIRVRGGEGDSGTSSSPSAPTLSFSASPASITEGQFSTLSWESEHTTDCTAQMGWSGNKALSGTQSVSPTTTTTYGLTCEGSGGEITRYATVAVTAPVPKPSLDFLARPTQVVSGESSMLYWRSRRATSCTASGDWSGWRSTNGAESTGPIVSPKRYVLTCSNTGGSVTKIATVSVRNARCIGSVPDNATMYSNDDVGLSRDTLYTYWPVDTGTRCQYRCDSGYTWNGSSCISSTPGSYSCIGSIPSNASRHDSEEESGLTSNTSWQYSSSDTSRKCQYACDTGFEWNGSSCEFIPPPEDPEDPSGSNAGTNWIEVTPGE